MALFGGHITKHHKKIRNHSSYFSRRPLRYSWTIDKEEHEPFVCIIPLFVDFENRPVLLAAVRVVERKAESPLSVGVRVVAETLNSASAMGGFRGKIVLAGGI